MEITYPHIYLKGIKLKNQLDTLLKMLDRYKETKDLDNEELLPLYVDKKGATLFQGNHFITISVIAYCIRNDIQISLITSEDVNTIIDKTNCDMFIRI